MAIEIVIVFGEYSRSVDPSSLNDGTNTRIHASTRLDRSNGTETRFTVCVQFAPVMRAASSRLGSTWRIPDVAVRNANGRWPAMYDRTIIHMVPYTGTGARSHPRINPTARATPGNPSGNIINVSRRRRPRKVVRWLMYDV